MYKNPYQIFGVDENMDAYELRKILLDYKIGAMRLNTLYRGCFTQVGPISMHNPNRKETVEQILGKRYELGLEFNQIPLGEDEIGDFLTIVTKFRRQAPESEGQASTIFAEDVKKRIEMYAMSAFLRKKWKTKLMRQ